MTASILIMYLSIAVWFDSVAKDFGDPNFKPAVELVL